MFRTLLIAAAVCLAPAARADLIVGDGFAYPAGPIVGRNGGTGWANSWTTTNNSAAPAVSSPGLTFSQNSSTLAVSGNSLTTPGGDLGAFRRPPTAFGAYGGSPDPSQDLWISFLVKNTSGGSMTDGYGGLSLFHDDPNTHIGTEQFFIGRTAGSSLYGFQNVSQAAVNDAQTGVFATGTTADTTTHLLVMNLTFTPSGTTYAALYVDPTPGVTDGGGQPTGYTSEIDNSNSPFVDGFQFDQFRFQSGGAMNSAFTFDEVRMGTQYLDVVPQQIAPTPEPGVLTFWLTGCGGLGLVALRRRRRAA